MKFENLMMLCGTSLHDLVSLQLNEDSLDVFNGLLTCHE